MLFPFRFLGSFFWQIIKSIKLVYVIGAFAFGAFLWGWTFGEHGLYELEHLLSIKTHLQKQQGDLEKEKTELLAETERLKEPRYVHHLIRKELGYLRPGEVLIKFHKD